MIAAYQLEFQGKRYGVAVFKGQVRIPCGGPSPQRH